MKKNNKQQTKNEVEIIEVNSEKIVFKTTYP